jgi:hypothetical protein
MSPLTTAQKEPRAGPDNHEDCNRASYCHADNQTGGTGGMPLIELRCKWRAESTSRLRVAAYRTSRDVIPWCGFLLIKPENEKNV